jgi:regulator of sirC expression with transglutaminase-like and TPR domain
VTRGLLDLSDEARRAGIAPDGLADRRTTLRRLGSLARETRARIDGGDHPVDALNQVVFEERGFRRDVEDLSLETTLLGRVLERRRGSCMGLGGLYLALGESLDLSLGGVLVPGHFLVRYKGERGRRDIELLKRGREMPRKWYRDRYQVPEGNPLYLQRALSAEETLAVYRYNLANELRARGRHRTALEHYRRVVARLPGFAEAWANLGLTLQKLKQRAHAERAYLKARAANPRLEGLERNLKLLRIRSK